MKSSISRISTGTPQAAAWIFALLAAVPAHDCFANDVDCMPLFEAMTRLFNTPSHEYLTRTSETSGEAPMANEIINTGKAMYIMVGGKWHNSTVTSAQLQQQEEQNRKNAKVTRCRLVREEAFNGVAATLFTAHTEAEYGTSDQQMWISKTSGLPLREIIDMDMGDRGGKSRAEIRVVYSGVEAPPVAPSSAPK